jgi:hypothetical protein
MKKLQLFFSLIMCLNCSINAVVQSVGPGDKVTVDQWGAKFISDKYRPLKSNKDCWDKFEGDKIILTEY